MKKIKNKNINKFIEHYFDCPYCRNLITDYGSDDFDRDDKGHIICEHCGKKIKEV